MPAWRSLRASQATFAAWVRALFGWKGEKNPLSSPDPNSGGVVSATGALTVNAANDGVYVYGGATTPTAVNVAGSLALTTTGATGAAITLYGDNTSFTGTGRGRPSPRPGAGDRFAQRRRAERQLHRLHDHQRGRPDLLRSLDLDGELRQHQRQRRDRQSRQCRRRQHADAERDRLDADVQRGV